MIEETPDFKTPPSYRKTNKRNQINRPGRNLSNVSRIQERARQIGIVRCHSGRKNNSNANMNRNHTIFPLQSTMVNSSYPGNDNLDCPAFFNELCPATQVIKFLFDKSFELLEIFLAQDILPSLKYDED